jgi:hypothetical protein
MTAMRLARPGVRLERVPGMLAALLVALWALGRFALLDAAPDERRYLVFGDTWIECLVGITLLSIPIFIGTM